jgi:hypothetical protein
VVGGGFGNVVSGEVATVGGGSQNTNSGAYAFIGGGYGNLASGIGAFVGGGGWDGLNVAANIASGAGAVIPGGLGNLASGKYGFAAGRRAEATNDGAFVWADSTDADFGSTVSNQFNVRAGGGARFVTSGAGMTIDGQSVLTSGSGNLATGAASFAGGGTGNTDQADYSFIGGGFNNTVQFGSSSSTIAGGSQNIVQSNAAYAVIAGGIFNTNNGLGAAVGGGGNNNAGEEYSTVAGGYHNSATGQFGVLGGGYLNSVPGRYGVLGGGNQNSAAGSGATVPGGELNLATGDFSFAAGQQAQALHMGSFVWADAQNAAFASTISNQFNVRAGNGLRISEGGTNGNVVIQPLGALGAGYQALNFNGFYDQFSSTEQRFNARKDRWRLVVDQRGAVDTMTIDAFNGATVLTALAILTNGNVGIGVGSPTNKLQVGGDAAINGNLNFGNTARQMLDLWGTQYAIGVQSSTLYFRSDFNFSWFKGGVHNDNVANPGAGGVEEMRLDSSGNLNVRGSVTANSLVLTSDRNAKENFEPVNGREVLEKVAALPMTRWNFKTDAAARHIGPMAQDFYTAFHVGDDERHIAVVDEGGVALAAIQGLNQKLEQKETEITELKHKNDSLEKRLAALEQIIRSQKSN